MSAETSNIHEPLRARRFQVDYMLSPPSRHWAGEPFLTHWLNAYTVTIPDGENFIIDTVRAFMDRIEDPQVKRDAQGLVGQEISHARAHYQFVDALRAQGFKLEAYLGFTRFLSFKILKPITPALQQLAFVVGIERVNELFAEITLASGKLARVEPAVRALYEWHFAEEIEHKSAAFDVYQAVSGNRFWLGFGVLFCYLLNLSFLLLACTTLLRQDSQLWKWSTWKAAFNYFFVEEKFLPRVTRGCFQILKRGFHPSQTQNRHLAEHVLIRRVIDEQGSQP